MKRPFTSNQAEELINKHSRIFEALETGASYRDNTVFNIQKCSGYLTTKKVLEVLHEVPVEELNNSKNKGIRTKALRDAGYDTLDKIYAAQEYQLASVYGISESAAYTVKRLVSEYAHRTEKEVKLRITSEDRNKYSNSLVMSLYKYMHAKDASYKCEQILETYKQHIINAMDDIGAPGLFFKWIIMSEDRKQEISDSYDLLVDYLSNNYYQKSRDALHEINTVNKVDLEECWEDFEKNSVSYYTALENIRPGTLDNEDKVYGLPEELAAQIQEECFFPDGLLCDLRRYQEWGVKYILHQGKVLLGDEMGLGKTVQAIAAMVSLKNTGATHFLVVCPYSILTNWYREIKKHSRLPVMKIHGSSKKNMIKYWIKNGGVGVTTYETTSAFQLEEGFKYSMLIVDEAHYIKNTNAQRTKNVANIASHADRILYMTGTALENKVEEMIKLIDDLQPDIAQKASALSFMATAEQFKNAIVPVYYRRKREDVLKELPDKIESEEWCTLLPEEEYIYEESVLDKRYADARRVSWNVDDLSRSSKANRLKELIEEAESEGRKVIVFSFFLDTINSIREFFGGRCLQPINGSVLAQRRQQIIDEFDAAPPGTVLLAQILSGGTGLNIQAGSVVILCEPQLKPSIENQAISRSYRMGQTRTVLVYRLLCENTLDEKILDALKEKQKIFDAFADESIAARETVELDNKAIGEMIKEEIERINKKRGFVQSEDDKELKEKTTD